MNSAISGVELTCTQMWVISDSARIGPLPAFLGISPKVYIYDDQEFRQRILIPLQEMDVLDAALTIHPAVIAWLQDICEGTEFLNVLFQYQGKNLRLVITRIQEQKNHPYNSEFVYMWVANGKARIGVSEIYSLQSLLNFINQGLGGRKPAQISSFSLSKHLLLDMVDKIIQPSEKFSLTDIQYHIDRLEFPPELREIVNLSSAAVEASATFLVTRRESNADQTSSDAITLLDTREGRILVHPAQKKYGTDIVVYESGTVDNIRNALDELFRSHLCSFWFGESN